MTKCNWNVSTRSTPIELPPDPDENLVPSLIQSSILPIMLRTVREQWDPYSKQQSNALWGVLDELLVFQDAFEKKKWMDLASTVVK